MNGKRNRLLAVVILLALSAASCRTAPLVDVPAIPLSRSLSDDAREKILRGIARSGWVAQEREPGEAVLHARYAKGKAFAVVAIDYSEHQIRISYSGSARLRCKPRGNTCERIHKAYNAWVRKLHSYVSEALYEPSRSVLHPSEAKLVIRQAIEEQPPPHGVTSVEVTDERVHVVKQIVRTKTFFVGRNITTVPTASTVYFNNLGQVEILADNGWHFVIVRDKQQQIRLKVYSREEVSLRRFIDALMVMSSAT